MKEKILALLRTSSDYISGQAICEKLGVSRTAVWKNINALKAEGYIIDAVNNKGYRLVGEPDIVTKEKIEAALTTSVIGRELYYYDETDSTNIRAKLAGETDGTHGALFVANEQKGMEHSEGNQHSYDISAPSGCADRECIQTYDPVSTRNGACSCRYSGLAGTDQMAE